jgi:hypothetical protein
MNPILILILTLVGVACEGEAPVLSTNPYSSSEESSPASFDYSKGARVGVDNLLSALDSCTEKGKFYDRALINSLPDDATVTQFSAACTSLVLAKIDCSKDGVISHNEAKSKNESFNTNVKDNIQGLTLGGYEVDQCLICLKDSEEDLCQVGNDEKKPPPVDIIRVHFVDKIGKTEATTILLK